MNQYSISLMTSTYSYWLHVLAIFIDQRPELNSNNIHPRIEQANIFVVDYLFISAQIQFTRLIQVSAAPHLI